MKKKAFPAKAQRKHARIKKLSNSLAVFLCGFAPLREIFFASNRTREAITYG
jgi:hypothetical protein